MPARSRWVLRPQSRSSEYRSAWAYSRFLLPYSDINRGRFAHGPDLWTGHESWPLSHWAALRSVRAQRVFEPLEQVPRVMRARGGLGVILDGEDGKLAVAHALNRAVVQVQMGHFDRVRQAVGIDREAVVLGGDLDLLRGQVHHRLIAAAVAEFELVRLAAKRQGQELMPEADAEDRLDADELPYGLDGVWDALGIARAV